MQIVNKIKRPVHSAFRIFSLFFLLWLGFLGSYLLAVNTNTVIFCLATFIILGFLSGNRLSISFFEIYLWLYFLILGVGIFFAKDRPIAQAQFFSYGLTSVVIYYAFKWGFSCEKDKKDFAKITAICAAITALIAILEVIFQKNIIYEYLIPNIFYTHYLALRRPTSTLLVPQVLATFLGVGLPFCYYGSEHNSSEMAKRLFRFCAVLIIIELMLSFSAMAVTGILATTIFYFFIRSNNKFRFIIFLLITVFIFTALVSCFIKEKSYLSGFLEDLNWSLRLKQIKAAVKMAKDHPFFGIGLGHYKLFFERYGCSNCIHYYNQTPDNMFLMLLTESGILAVSAFFLFISSLFKGALRKRQNDSLEMVHFRQALISAILAILLMMWAYDALYWSVPLFLFWALCGILASV